MHITQVEIHSKSLIHSILVAKTILRSLEPVIQFGNKLVRNSFELDADRLMILQYFSLSLDPTVESRLLTFIFDSTWLATCQCTQNIRPIRF